MFYQYFLLNKGVISLNCINLMRNVLSCILMYTLKVKITGGAVFNTISVW